MTSRGRLRSGFWVPLCLATAACGRPATQAECEEIVEHIARLHIDANRPARPEAVAAEVSEFKARVRDRTLQSCVGKPVTERALTCARAASDVHAVEVCFR